MKPKKSHTKQTSGFESYENGIDLLNDDPGVRSPDPKKKGDYLVNKENAVDAPEPEEPEVLDVKPDEASANTLTPKLDLKIVHPLNPIEYTQPEREVVHEVHKEGDPVEIGASDDGYEVDEPERLKTVGDDSENEPDQQKPKSSKFMTVLSIVILIGLAVLFGFLLF